MKFLKKLIKFFFVLIFFVWILLIIAPYFIEPHVDTKWDYARPKMTPIESAIDAFKINTGKLPAKLEDLVTCPAGLENLWKGPYLREIQLYDPWQHRFIYQISSANPNGYVLISYGAEGAPGGEGYNADINNK